MNDHKFGAMNEIKSSFVAKLTTAAVVPNFATFVNRKCYEWY